jgi:hypothetical protein
MSAPFVINGWQDINKFFVKGTPRLHEDFAFMEKPLGQWGEWIEYDGVFETNHGASARVTLMGTKRPTTTNKWNRMVALQGDCTVSCDPPVQNISVSAWDNRWYHLFETSFRSPVYDMTQMWLEAMNLPRQIENIERGLKDWVSEILEEFYQGSYTAMCQHKWVGVDNNISYIREALWDFERDANGDPNYDRIVVDPSLISQIGNVSLLTQDVLDYISIYAYYNKSWNFMDSTLKPLMVDPITSQYLPKQDNNQRKDNRVFDPETLNPNLGYEREYAGWGHKVNMFQFRYNWDLTNPNYPNGVLQRVHHNATRSVTSGAVTDINPDFLNASFCIAIPFRPDVVKFQNFTPPKSVGKDVKFEAVTHAYEGIWNWINETNNITPANETKEKGYFLAAIKKAAKPVRWDLGHAILYRLYDSPGVQRSTRPLSVSVGTYYPLTDLACPPLDQYPAPMVTRSVCGNLTRAGCECAPCTDVTP